MRSKLIIGVVCVCCGGVMWVVWWMYEMLLSAYHHSTALNHIHYSWFFKLLLNLVGYGTVLLPGFILYKYLNRINYFEKISNTSRVSRCLFACFGEPLERLPDSTPHGKPAEAESGSSRESLELMLCFTGLLGAYLVWGLLQEKIMTQKYTLPDGRVVQFNDSQLLVFINRLAALVVAWGWLWRSRSAPLVGPLYQYSYSALSNVLSAWCQYEALRYVSFPTQVLSKSCKVLPVMMMGKLISRNKYQPYEYLTAAGISLGMVLFMLDSRNDHSEGTLGWAGGVCLLSLYMVCDSFTSSWQSALFSRYSPSPLQMLCAVNLFSCALTATALLHSPTTMTSLAMLQSWSLVCDVTVLSVSSALGSLLIYRTIARFGAVIFTIIMTLRQAISILLSCLVYGHSVSASGALGITLVFAAVGLRMYCSHRLRTARHRTPRV